MRPGHTDKCPSFLADAEALIRLMSPGIGWVMFRRKSQPGGIRYAWCLTLLQEAGGLSGLMRDWEVVEWEPADGSGVVSERPIEAKP